MNPIRLKFYLCVMVGCTVPVYATAQSVNNPVPTPNVVVPSISTIRITAEELKRRALGDGNAIAHRERKTLRESSKWQQGQPTSMQGDNGHVVYHYGEALHTVVCATLRICDVQLERGEQVRHLVLGDTVRWTVSSALSGKAPDLITHLLIKPNAPKLQTSMVVTTDRRVYHLNLKSTLDEFIPVISFAYPKSTPRTWSQLYPQATEKPVAPSVGADASHLNFGYRVSGDKPEWTPVRVYNDGTRTIIEMPRAMAHTQAPAFVVRDDEGDVQVVNYRLRDNRFIVDTIFDRGFLLAGVGRKQKKVVIERIVP